MTSEREGLLDEHRLRRALRLDASELPPRLDPALIASAARGDVGRTREMVTLAGITFAAGWASSELARVLVATLAAATGVDPLAVAIGGATAIAVRIAPIAELATAPAIPLAILASLTLAIAFEQRRSTGHAAAT